MPVAGAERGAVVQGAEPEGGQEDGDDQAQVPGEEQGPSRGLPTSSALPVPPEVGGLPCQS